MSLQEYLDDLKRRLRERRSVREIALRVGIHPATMYSFMQNKSSISMSKIILIDNYMNKKD